MGLFDRLKQRLTRTRTAISDGLSGLFRGGREIDNELLDELEEMLFTSDLGSEAIELVDQLKRQHKRGELKGEDDVRASLRAALLERLDTEPAEIVLAHSPTVVLVVGVNGSGKTTSIAKLAQRFTSQGKRVIVGAADTFRAAAADQLEIWAGRVGCDIVRKNEGADPAAVAYETVDRALREGHDLVIIDTAGRLHTQSNLMKELEKVRRVVAKRLEGAPHEVLLVIDGTNGQNAINQAKQFTQSAEVTGLVVAKLDGTARGGAIFGIRRELGLPVRYIGTGETVEALEAFEPQTFVDAILAVRQVSANS
ncbi:signal recognition particle-docking protein FtsY [Engelhardtia mirabilis]|uniref:Signal recognition particle receptor FtsY n=1 Tax=Engelhardtia mirabilis TaxID=2528011 RepID=A0A518BPZ2_9BACT|nr:Signal recognition particle receptor FtsY [Planctomycetes bacterium Pla133]QDV03369.1 Signal recognition particle receptor FtsY [Planctomycetes bacterium Pla86]